MKKILINIIQSIHRILGTILCILFVVWFISGMVMIFHTFPKIDPNERIAKMDILTPNELPSIQEYLINLDDTIKVRSITLNKYMKNLSLHIQTRDSDFEIGLDSSYIIPAIDSSYIVNVSALWCKAPIECIDTLHKVDQWIPFGRLKEDMPIYKIHFKDKEAHELYITSTTGKAIQFTDHNSRFWAWVGAIPHWIYFTELRQNQELWIKTVIWLSGLGAIMCIGGLIWGIKDLIAARRRNLGITPYKKRFYRWHHVFGLFFGVFVFTFVFSGMMSLADVPKWISSSKDQKTSRGMMRSESIDVQNYRLDYRKALEFTSLPVRQVEWKSYDKIPFYVLYTDSDKIYVDASDTVAKRLFINKDYIIKSITSKYPNNTQYHLTLLSSPDNYYISRKKDRIEFPVWKVLIDNADKSCFYVNLYTGASRYIDKTSRWHHWMYQAFHSYDIKGIADNNIMWNLVMWITLIGGTIISLTGIWLGIGYVRRKFFKKRHKQRTLNI